MDHTHEHKHPTPSRWFPLWQAALIGGIGIMLVVKVVSGALPLYIHTKYTPLILGTGLILVALALVHAWLSYRSGGSHGHTHDHEHTPHSWRSPAMLALMVPILLGLVVPSRALGSAAIENRGFGNSGMRTVQSVAGPETNLAVPDPSQWTMLDWVNALLYQPDNPRLQGQPIELVGFVWRRAELENDKFILSRFVVSCCTADSLAIGLPVVWPDSARLTNDSWIRVQGTVGLAEVDGREEAVILADEIIPIDQPSEPYLYP